MSFHTDYLIKVLVIASIHQPSTNTFELFDKLLLMSKGKVTYNGPVADVKSYFAGLGQEVIDPSPPSPLFVTLLQTKQLTQPRCPSTPIPPNS